MASDCHGREVQVGSRVRVLGLPPFLERDLPIEEWRRLQQMIGEIFEVQEVDEYGAAWIEKWWQDADGEHYAHALALASHEMEVVQE